MTKFEHEPAYRLGAMIETCHHAQNRMKLLLMSAPSSSDGTRPWRAVIRNIVDDLQTALDAENAAAESAKIEALSKNDEDNATTEAAWAAHKHKRPCA